MGKKLTRQEEYARVDFSEHGVLPLKDKVIWASCSFGICIHMLAPAYYQMYFYTDVIGISAAIGGTIIFVASLLNVFTQFGIAAICDNVQVKQGRYRGVMIAGWVIMMIAWPLLWSGFPDASPAFKYAWAFAGCVLSATVAGQLLFLPMNCQLTNMTTNLDERASTTSIRGICKNIGTLFASSAVLPLVAILGGHGSSEVRGWFLTALIILVLIEVPYFFNIKIQKKYELNYDGAPRDHLVIHKDKDRPSFFKQLGMGFRNRPCVVLAIGAVLVYALQNIRNSMVVYMFKYYFEQPDLTSLALLFNVGTGIIGALIIGWMIKVFKDTAKAYMASAVISAGMYLLFYALIKLMGREAAQGSIHFGMLFILFGLCGLVQGSYYFFIFAIIPNAQDYGKWKFKFNQAGTVFAIVSMGMSFGTSGGSFIQGHLLDWIGYVPGAVQTPEVADSILFVAVIVPAVLSLAHAFVLLFIGVNDRQVAEYNAEMREWEKVNGAA